MTWPTTPEALMVWQEVLAGEAPARFEGGGPAGGCFVCFPRGETGPGARGPRLGGGGGGRRDRGHHGRGGRALRAGAPRTP